MARQPTAEQTEDVVYSVRYGDTEEVDAFIAEFGAEAFWDARDDRGNGPLHMICANGHLDLLRHLLPNPPPSPASPSLRTALLHANDRQSTPLHWAALNGHLVLIQHLLEASRALAPQLETGMLESKNAAGRSPVSEAELNAHEDVVVWMLGRMDEIDKGRGGDKAGPVEGEGAEGEDGEKEVELARMKMGESVEGLEKGVEELDLQVGEDGTVRQA